MSIKSFYVERNQAMREAFVIHVTDKFEVVYYFMPKGALYLNKIPYNKRDHDYTAMSQKQLIEYIDRHADIKSDVVAMLHHHNEVLEELLDGGKLKWHYERLARKTIEENNKLIEKYTSIAAPPID